MRMQSNYMHLWSSSFGSDAAEKMAKIEWQKRLCQFDGKTIDAAIDYFIEEKQFDSKNKVPNLHEFYQACKMKAPPKIKQKEETILLEQKTEFDGWSKNECIDHLRKLKSGSYAEFAKNLIKKSEGKQ